MKSFREFLKESKMNDVLIDLDFISKNWKTLELQLFPEEDMVSFKTSKNEYFDFKFNKKDYDDVVYSLNLHHKSHGDILNIPSIKIVLNKYYGNSFKKIINDIIKVKR